MATTFRRSGRLNPSLNLTEEEAAAKAAENAKARHIALKEQLKDCIVVPDKVSHIPVSEQSKDCKGLDDFLKDMFDSIHKRKTPNGKPNCPEGMTSTAVRRSKRLNLSLSHDQEENAAEAAENDKARHESEPLKVVQFSQAKLEYKPLTEPSTEAHHSLKEAGTPPKLYSNQYTRKRKPIPEATKIPSNAAPCTSAPPTEETEAPPTEKDDEAVPQEIGRAPLTSLLVTPTYKRPRKKQKASQENQATTEPSPRRIPNLRSRSKLKEVSPSLPMQDQPPTEAPPTEPPTEAPPTEPPTEVPPTEAPSAEPPTEVPRKKPIPSPRRRKKQKASQEAKATTEPSPRCRKKQKASHEAKATTEPSPRRRKKQKASQEAKATTEPSPRRRKKQKASQEAKATTEPSPRRIQLRSRSKAKSDMKSELEESSNDKEQVFEDDGARRGRIQQTVLYLRCVAEALEAVGLELDVKTIQSVAKTKMSRNKNKEQVRRGRGLGRPRGPAPPSGRPLLKAVGDSEFGSSPPCSKVKTTIRLLLVENMPGPYRSYKMFPIDSRLSILRKFLQMYTWGPDEDVRRCLDVYEDIAADVYGRELVERRKDYMRKYGEDKGEWKKHPPCWCRNVDAWKGLCDIWSKEKWEQQSSTNRANMTKEGPIIHHVAGSKSMYKHMQTLISQRDKEGKDVGFKDLFDATHMRKTPNGMVYVNDKAKRLAETFEDVRQSYGPEVPDELIWASVVGGEERGRLFGLGKRSRTSKRNTQSMPSTTTSTATTAASLKSLYSRDEVDNIVAQKLADQEMRYKSQMEDLKKMYDYNKECIQRLLEATGTNPPPFNKGPLGDAIGKQGDGTGKQGDAIGM